MAEVSQTAVHERKVTQYSHREQNAVNGRRKCLAFGNIFTIVEHAVTAGLKPVYFVSVDNAASHRPLSNSLQTPDVT